MLTWTECHAARGLHPTLVVGIPDEGFLEDVTAARSPTTSRYAIPHAEQAKPSRTLSIPRVHEVHPAAPEDALRSLDHSYVGSTHDPKLIDIERHDDSEPSCDEFTCVT
jgi:hypothetical protein